MLQLSFSPFAGSAADTGERGSERDVYTTIAILVCLDSRISIQLPRACFLFLEQLHSKGLGYLDGHSGRSPPPAPCSGEMQGELTNLLTPYAGFGLNQNIPILLDATLHDRLLNFHPSL